jgi:pilus assembly protein Flp/PilA
MPRAVRVRITQLYGLSSANAALSLPALGRHRHSFGALSVEMGEAEGTRELSNAASRFAAYTDVARFTLKRFLSDMSGATAIEYAMMAGGIAVVVVAAVNLLGQNVKATFFDKVVAALTSP